MKFDPHIHSVYSPDARSYPKDILRYARKIGLDAIAISDHDEIKGSRVTRELAQDIIVVPSIEISSKNGHILGLGVDEIIPKGLSGAETVELIHDAGGLAIVPHPFSYYRKGLFCKEDTDLDIEGVETKNARYFVGYSNMQGRKLAEKRNLATLGASDSHFIESIGDAYTEVDTNGDDSVDGILDAIKKRQCKSMGHATSNVSVVREYYIKKVLKQYPQVK